MALSTFEELLKLEAVEREWKSPLSEERDLLLMNRYKKRPLQEHLRSAKINLTHLLWNTRKQPHLAKVSTFYPVQIGTEARALSVSRTVKILEAINVDLK
ncbi:hypothetical protein FISHEDRAFT_74891 [Fistulina hepatica ATCC 64428]|uniref:Uncharacterized protein n=1 Tax=Fistulina hepatica ATCC 64428 TaxID=1128425 RepID=A0A0D7A8S2_9AGAR|nr:hypothetical protein FISHEDRAFT_74891 [Fistulina hepatica ATCC 64428]